MLSTWIEADAKGRHGGQVRAGMWSAVVVGTHPIAAGQEVWLELNADDDPIGPLPAFWLENKGVNSLWHVPIPPQAVNVRLHYRARAVCRGESASSRFQDTIVRPNLPWKAESPDSSSSNPEGLVGNRMMTVRVDSRGCTHDIYFPTVGLHSDVRPAEGELPRSRSHFRSIVAGLAIGRRLDWFGERLAWGAFQHYQGATNLLMTELNWRHGPIRVLATDFVAKGPCLPRTAGGTRRPASTSSGSGSSTMEPSRPRGFRRLHPGRGQRRNRRAWPELARRDRTLLAINRGHGHVNRKLARDATVEFAIALDGRGEVQCKPTGPNEALLLRRLELLAGESVIGRRARQRCVHGLAGRSRDLRALAPARPGLVPIQRPRRGRTGHGKEWDGFVEPLPSLHFPKPAYAVSLRRSALGASLHADEQWGGDRVGFERGLSAYCWPREAIWVGGAMERIGHPEIGRKVFQWLAAVEGRTLPIPTGSRSTASMASPSGKRRRSTSRR